MHDLDRNEDRLRGTYDFPFEFHHIDETHPRYVMSYHWHVRGSLEEQTMNMAKSAAKLFEENLRYSNGEPVKVVIADTKSDV